MTALVPEPTTIGTPEAFREYIAEMLAMARIQAEIGERFAEIGDDVGLEYAVRRLVAYVRQAAGTLPDLRDHKTQEALV